MRVQLADGAKRDFNEGLHWYRKRSDQAADRFTEMTDITIGRILKDPTRYRQIRPNIRTICYKRYPYSLIYLIQPDTLVIIAVAHDKRREGYWNRRLG